MQNAVIRFAICDDDQEMTGHLDSLVMALRPLYNQEFEVAVFLSGESFCEHLNRADEIFDIVLMDIEMRGITGVEAGRKLRENIASDQTLLIFVSWHKGYYHEIIDLNVFCFIPKPIFENEFNLKIGNAIKKVLRQRQLPIAPRFTVKINGGEIHIPVSSIMHLESDARKVHVHTADEIYTYYGKLKEEEAKLPAHTFSRIHNSYLINFAHMISISAKSVTMKDGRRFPISEKYRDKVKTAYAHYRGNLK